MSGVTTMHFFKDCWKFIQIHQYYTMALIQYSLFLHSIQKESVSAQKIRINTQ